jgi:hypothetical protein
MMNCLALKKFQLIIFGRYNSEFDHFFVILHIASKQPHCYIFLIISKCHRPSNQSSIAKYIS